LYDIGGYQLPFLLGAGLAFIDVLVVALLMDDAAAAAPQQVDASDDSEFSWRDVLKHRLMFILGVVTLGSSSLTLMEPTLPLYLQTTYKVGWWWW